MANTSLLRPSPLRLRVAKSRAVPPKWMRQWEYLKYSMLHPWHVVMLAGATGLGVVNWSIWVLLFVFAFIEVALLVTVLNLKAFRDFVDGRLATIEKSKAAESRATLLLQMSDDHRRELLKLEQVADRIKNLKDPPGTAEQLAIHECLNLIALYAKIGIAWNNTRECVTAVSRPQLQSDAATLSSQALYNVLARKRLQIVEHRIEQWDKSRAALDVMAEQMNLIIDLVHLSYERLYAPQDVAQSTMVNIDKALRDLDDTHSTMDEMQEFAVQEDIDPQYLHLGRA